MLPEVFCYRGQVHVLATFGLLDMLKDHFDPIIRLSLILRPKLKLSILVAIKRDREAAGRQK